MQKNKLSGIFLFVIFMMACSFLLVAPQAAHAQGKTILIVGPHPDDEALCCSGIIYAAKQAGNTVKVAMLTNGDSQNGGSVTFGATREGETVSGMIKLGLTEQDVIFLGYGDGMTMQMYESTSPTTVFTSIAGQTQTYATRGLGGVDYHTYLNGTPGSYNRQTILADFIALLTNLHPDEIYTTSFLDGHTDHEAAYGFTAEALINLRKQGLLLNTRIHETIIHAPCESCIVSYHWPNSVFTPTLPLDLPPMLYQIPLSPTNLEAVPVPAVMQDTNRPTNLKNSVISSYGTQGGTDPNNWLFSFVKKNELFWVANFPANLAPIATVTASSQTTNGAAIKAVNGNYCGDPISICDSEEWHTMGELAGAWIKLTWSTPVTLSRAILFDRPNLVDNVLAGTLTFSDGSTVQVGALPNSGIGLEVPFPPRTVTSMQFNVTGAVGSNIGLSEIEAFGTISGASTTFAPQISQSVSPYESTILDTQTINLDASAFDINGDILTYTWAADGGSISSAGVFNPPTVASPTVFTITLTVSDGHGNSTQSTGFVTATHAAAISSLTLNPTSVKGGSSSIGTVTLDKAAPLGGAVVALTANNSTPASFPSTVTIPSGSTSANFTITTVPTSDTPVNITGTYGGVSQLATLTVTGREVLYSLMLNPTSVTEPGTSTATITLNGPAPFGGRVAQLVSGTSATTVPSSVTIPGGSNTATFQVSTNVVGTPTPAAISAYYDFNTDANATLLVNPPGNSVASVSMNPIAVIGGTSSTGTVNLSSAAPSGGLTVTLSNSNTLVATVPATVHVGFGNTTATFSVSTVAVGSSTPVTIAASLNASSQQTTLTVDPPSILSVSMSPSTVTGGTSSTGTVKLTGVAPTGGATVSLFSSSGAAVPPATVTVSAGSTTKTFTTTTTSVSSITSATITAAYNNTSDFDTLTINPAATAPAFTSANNTTFTVGTAGSFTVTASGYPTPTLSESGALPSGVTFAPATGVLSGTPTVTGTFNLVFTAHNTSGPNATQNFTLTVNKAPAITSANNTTFTAGAAGSFTVTATGTPTPTLSESGALPSGVTFTPATGVLSGTPTVGGTFNLVFTAHNTASPDATQNFILTVNQAPAITSANNAAFTINTLGSFTVTATGTPTPTLSESGALPNGVTFTAATGVLSGTPTVTGTFNLVFTAHNTSGADATQNFTLTVKQAPAITSANNTAFTINTLGSFTVTATGFPAPTLSESGALPNGVIFTAATGVLSGTPTVSGTFNLVFTAHNTSGPDATQNFTLTVNQAPAITSANNTAFTVGSLGSFTVTATGFPSPTLSESGALPNGVTFTAATGVLSGTPTVSGTFNLVFTAHNTSGADATQNFTLTVNQAPVITSANNAAFTINTLGSFTVTATGFPAPTLSESGALPNGVTFTAATGVLSGTPAVSRTFNLVFTAHNTSGPDATQNFTLTVGQAPAITSANNAAFTVGSLGSFAVTTTGFPTPTLSESGALPNGVNFDISSGILSGTPTVSGTFHLVFTAHNFSSPDAAQNFTLTVNPISIGIQNPSFETTNTLDLNCGSGCAYNSGAGIPGWTTQGTIIGSWQTGSFITLPPADGLVVAYNDGGTISQVLTSTLQPNTMYTLSADVGTSASGSSATYSIQLLAGGQVLNTFQGAISDLPVGSLVTKTVSYTSPASVTPGRALEIRLISTGMEFDVDNVTLTLNFNPTAPTIASANTASFTEVNAGAFLVAMTGFPAPTVSESGALPAGVTFNTNTNMLGGTPAGGTAGTYPITFTAHNSSGPDAVQSFTLTVSLNNIAIQNPSFETTNTLNLNCGSGCAYNSGAGIPGWTTQGTIIGSWQTGPFITLPPADGLVVAYNDGGTISQVLTSTLQPNTMYTLSADVGTSASGSSATYSIQLLAGGQVLNTFQGAISDLPVGSLVTKTVSYTSPASVTPGRALEIRLISTGMEFDVDNVTLTLNFNPTAPTIASANTASFTEVNAGAFLVAMTGFPAPTVSESGALPAGVTFNTNTNMLGGTPAGGTAGTYPITFTAHNSSGPDAVQSFTLTVSLNNIAIQNPSFETTNTLNLNCGSGCAYNSGAENPGWTTQGTIIGSWQTGPFITLPPADGLVVAYNDGGTISQVLTSTLQPNTMYTLSADVGTSASGSSATYSIQLLAGGQVLNTFQGAISDLPVGSLVTKTVSYTSPASVTPGRALEIRLISTGMEFDVDNVTLTLNFNPTAPTIISANTASLTEGSAGTFSVGMTGFPAPTVSESGALPSGVTFNTSTNVLGGTPAGGTAGTYPITFTAHNSSGPDAVQNFTLIVNAAPNYITIQNPSFEITNSLSSSCGTGCAYNLGAGIPGWTAGANAGSWQVGSGYLTLPSSDGLVVGYSNSGTISQVLSSTLQPNTTYTLSADIGHRSDGLVTDYTIQLLAGGQVLNTFVGNNGDIPAGTFASRSVTYTSPSSVNPNQALEIRFTNSTLQLDLDNVRLTAE